MPWILVAESEGRFAERIRDGLAADGWQVEIVASVEAATALASDRPPDLLLASAELEGAAALVEKHSRRRGGAGAVALLPEIGGDAAVAEAADDSISKPFTDQELRLLVRRFAVTGHAPRKPPPAGADEPRLTSKDLFGDVLAEMGEKLGPDKPAAAPPAAAAPRPPAERPRPKPAAAGSDVDKVLEKTLSGLLEQDKKPARAKPAARSTDAGVDDLISRTLSGLGAPERPRKAPPARPAAAAPPPPAPEPAAESVPPEPQPVSDTPALDRLFESSRPPAGETRRPSQELDFSELDELARPAPRSRASAPGADRPESAPTLEGPKDTPFGTQRVALPAALRGRPAATEFGQYTLLERIAVGGMAEVWKARRKGVEGFQKTVAIKKILAHLTDSSDFVTMFIDEAKLAAQLNHTNIIHIYDLGKIGDDYYIAMEYVDGRDMRTILNTAREKGMPLAMGTALLVASRLASALDHAHRMKDFEGRPLEIVHRDVSPQNVLISFEGEVKLCDFGIVKAVSKASKTQMGALKGKLQYMSPEQAWGRTVDARSDIFSLGSLLFEMLTGRRLFAGDSEMSVLDAVREGRIQAPRDLDPRLPLEVNALVLKALAKDPADRFESAGEMQKQIDSILASLKPTPTQHDLAETMKRLFGTAELEPEALEAPEAPAELLSTLEPLAAEPATAKPPATAEKSAGAAVAAEAARPITRAGDAALEPTTGGGRGMLWIGLAAILVLALVGYFLFGRGGKAPGTGSEPGATAPAETIAPPAEGTGEPQPADEATEPSPEAGAGQAAPAGAEAPPVDVAKIVDDQVKKREEALRRQYEAELERKQQEVAEASKPADEPAAAPEPEAKVAAPPAQQKPASAPPAPEPEATTAESAPDTTPPATREPSPPAAKPAPTPTSTRPTPPPPPKPTVKEGDLVQPGAGVRPPVLVSIDRPEYPAIARRLKVEGTVVMSLLVDEKGQVLDVRIESGVRENVGINEVAVEAARSAKFRPATKDGVRVKMWYQLKVPFKL